jgi:antitoxin VapB
MAASKNDESVGPIANELQGAMNAPTIKDASRAPSDKPALTIKKPMQERLAAAQEMVARMGPRDPNFDMKAFCDEMWDDL